MWIMDTSSATTATTTAAAAATVPTMPLCFHTITHRHAWCHIPHYREHPEHQH
jgi:hypothetical protein